MGPEPMEQSQAGKGAMHVCVLGSGSRGNSTYVSDGVTSVLVDAGFSARETERRLHSRGLSAADLSAILITHEHGDHVKGVARLARRHRLAVYLTSGTRHGADPLRDLPQLCQIRCGGPFQIRTLAIHPFSISHDAGDPSASPSAATAAGSGSPRTSARSPPWSPSTPARRCLLVFEANHDPQMLNDGPYPWYLNNASAAAPDTCPTRTRAVCSPRSGGPA